jgi:hypothetical protein
VRHLKKFLVGAAVVATTAIVAVSVAAAGDGSQYSYGSNYVSGSQYSYATQPVRASVISPRPRASAGVGGTFSVDIALEARSTRGNNLLAGYTAGFNDPNKPSFHPGPNAAAPGLVVLLSTTPKMADTPLQGPNTNLAGVFQINDVTQAQGLRSTLNSWIVTVPGFFGKNQRATLTVFAVKGTAPAVVNGTEKPISNVVRESFSTAG